MTTTFWSRSRRNEPTEEAIHSATEKVGVELRTRLRLDGASVTNLEEEGSLRCLCRIFPYLLAFFPWFIWIGCNLVLDMGSVKRFRQAVWLLGKGRVADEEPDSRG